MERLTIEYIKSKLSKLSNGYICLSHNYKNNKIKLDFICPNKHKFKMTWNNFYQTGNRCPVCYGKQRLTILIIKKELKKKEPNYILLSNNYKNSKTKLEFICNKKHKFKMTWDNFYQSRNRCPVCYKENRIGENNPNWKGGLSYEPYCCVWFDIEYKESIKQRDNYTCQNESCRKISNKICIHHINYIKKDCNPENLITVCFSCNARANFNRKYWKEYYTKRRKLCSL